MQTKQQPQTKMYRQGDVLIREVADIPEGAKALDREGGRVILAHGEVTGHAHAILAPKAMLYAFEETGAGGALRRYLDVTGGSVMLPAQEARAARAWSDDNGEALEEPAQPAIPERQALGVALEHEEHSTIVLPVGRYEVVRQREYHPEELRMVAD